MLTKTNRIICDGCRHFIAFQDLADGIATHYCATPDSDRSTETFESVCRACSTKEQEKAA
jgi:hypothetical protein